MYFYCCSSIMLFLCPFSLLLFIFSFEFFCFSCLSNFGTFLLFESKFFTTYVYSSSLPILRILLAALKHFIFPITSTLLKLLWLFMSNLFLDRSENILMRYSGRSLSSIFFSKVKLISTCPDLITKVLSKS